ncbi:hypothetical protein N7452_001187 [Penicillium brevicompactum]|uniref:NACHT domain-containing protein n=1 Tax=Penicillium brevicompactum TaxID=5074 RepID=A0A9W9R7I9_PENBR|nr:hypothetical protein N7452_001187 [Penicillium brevicompactum]
MEPAGLAVGILGLVGLFNTCLDILDKFDSWRDYGSESRSLTAQFKAHKIQLERWGLAVGLGKDGLSDQHDKLLDDPHTLLTVEELLSAIRDVCRYDDDADSKSKPTFEKHAHSRGPMESKRQKLSWALRDKPKRIAQVAHFSSIVQTLHALVPPKGVERVDVSKLERLANGDKSSGHLNSALLVPGGCIAEFERVLHQIECEIQAETKRDLQKWLLGDHLPNDRYEQYAEGRIESTCDWILNRPWFQDWCSPSFSGGHPKVLWINGPAGFGKSVLCTKIIDHVSSISDAPVAHFFFSSDIEREDPYVAIRSWVSQFISHPTAFSLIREKWADQERQKATRGDVSSLLRDILTSVSGCTLIIDGLDECIWHKGNQTACDDNLVPNFMEALMRATSSTDAQLMITSRDEPEIRTSLPAQGYGASIFEHKITLDDVRPDVLSYSKKLVYDELRKSTDTAKQSLSEKLADRCNGQFLWVKLQQKSLRRNSWKSHKELERVINSTPTGLQDIYERNWMKILKLPEEDRVRALSLLRWTAFSLRPLTVAETTEALLISEDCNEVQTDQLPENVDMNYIENGILLFCGSLLDIRSPHIDCDDGLKTIHLAHFSVKQYLLYNFSTELRLLQLHMSPGSFTEPFENTLLSKMCLRYLNSSEVLPKHPEGDQGLVAFFNYAAASWQQHASAADPRDAGVVELPGDHVDDMEHTNSVYSPASPLYYAARLGLIDTVKFLINDRKHGTEEKGLSGMTAFGAACQEGKVETAQILLESGANINASDNDGSTPALVASARGHLAVVKFLLDNGADMQVANKLGWTAANMASRNGHLTIVKILLESGIDMEATDIHGSTPALVASARGHLAVVKFLLDNGADMQVANKLGWTAANMASRNGHLTIVKILLESGIDMEATDIHGSTPAMMASSRGHLAVVKFLLDNGADMQVANKFGWTVAHEASMSGHIGIVKILLESGIDMEPTTNEGSTPAIVASMNGRHAVVALLLENGVDINFTNSETWTLVNAASVSGSVEMVEFLVKYKANINVADL